MLLSGHGLLMSAHGPQRELSTRFKIPDKRRHLGDVLSCGMHTCFAWQEKSAFSYLILITVRKF